MIPFKGGKELKEWIELEGPDGKIFYYNQLTDKSTWEKPDSLKGPGEKLKESPWREYFTETGRRYYFNVKNKTSVWEIPPEDRDAFERMVLKEKEKESRYILSTYNGPLHFTSRQQAEDAFFALLSDRNVTSSWTWEDCMREFINHPIYRAIATGTERKSIFTKFVDKIRASDEAQKAANLIRFREDFKLLVASTKEATSAAHYKRFCEINSRHPSFRAIETEKEREQLFKDAIEGKFRFQKEQERVKRRRGIEKFAKLLQSLKEIDSTTKWKEAQKIYKDSAEYKNTAELRELEPIDFLITFEDHIKGLERLQASEKQQRRDLHRRTERKNREAFNAMLHQLVEEGMISAKSKWKELYSLIKNSETFLNVVGQNGSTPQELFFDLVSDLKEKVQKKQRNLLFDLESIGFYLTKETPKAEFFRACQSLKHELNSTELDDVYQDQMDKLLKDMQMQEKDEKRKVESRRSDFKALIRHLKSITVNSKWDEIRPLIVSEKAFVELNDEKLRVEIFEKRVRYIKEKMEREKEREEAEEGEVKDEDGSRRSASEKRSKRSRSRSASRSPPSRSPSRSADKSRSRRRSKELNYSRNRSPDRKYTTRYRSRSRGRRSDHRARSRS